MRIPPAFFLLVALAGCDNPARTKCEGKQAWTAPVDSVLLHEPGHYSVFLRSGDGVLRRVQFQDSGGRVTLVRDAEGEAWVEVAQGRFMNNTCIRRVTIHLGSVELGGGGWDHGKFGRGQTVPIR